MSAGGALRLDWPSLPAFAAHCRSNHRPRFNKHVIQHRFCPNCGIHPYGEGKAPNGDAVAAVNIRCIEGIDLAAVPVQHYDGRSK